VVRKDWYPNDFTGAATNISCEYWTPSQSVTTSDMVTPNFRRRIARGEIINNPFISRKVAFTPPQPTAFARTYHMPANGSQNWAGSSQSGNRALLPEDWMQPITVEMAGYTAMRQRVIDTAVQKAHANIDVSKMLALATAAEGAKTVDSIASILTRVYKIVRAVTRLDGKYLAKQISRKELSDRYMEARYALRPLMYDAMGVIDALYEARQHNRFTGRGYASESAAFSTSPVQRSCGWAMVGDFTQSWTYSVTARAGVLVGVNVNPYQKWGLDQIAESVWELIPFSFILGWFLDVGTAIAALTPNMGVSQLASWVTVKENIRTETNMVNARSTLGAPYTVKDDLFWQGQYHVHEEQVLERIVNPSLSVWPAVNVRLDTLKILDLGLILKQVMARK